MTHANDELFERITAYLDGDMSAEEKAAFEAEVDTNDELRDLMMAATEAMEVVSRVTAPKPPEDFDNGVARVIRRRSRGRFFGSWRHSHYQGSWLFALISLAFLAAWMLLVTPERMDALLGPAPGSGTAPEDEWEMQFPEPIVPQEGTQTPAVPLPGGVPVDAAPRGESDGSGASAGASAGSGAGAGVDLSRPVVQAQMQVWVYVVETALAGDELRHALVERVGSERLEPTENGYRVRLPVAEQVGMAARLQEIGVVRRDGLMLTDLQADTWLEVVTTER